MWFLLIVIVILLLLQGVWINFWLLGLAFLLVILVSLLSRTWFWRASKQVRMKRILQEQAFNGDIVPVELELRNLSILPVPWLILQDYVPSGLDVRPSPEWLLSLHGRERKVLHYEMTCKRRGRYRIGALNGRAGVIFDTPKEPGGKILSWPGISRLVVYPEVVPLERLMLPSRLPLGNIRTRQPLLPDPSRPAGVREYQPGDDPRHIDWRNTARMNQLLVKQFERTRIVPLAIFLDLRLPNLQFGWQQTAEAAIVVAASLAARANELKQAFGLYSNGFDRGWDIEEVRSQETARPELAPRSGTAWLYEILDKLAGIQASHNLPRLDQLAGHWSSTLPWGATIAIVGVEPYPALVTEVTRLRKAGFNLIVVFTGAVMHSQEGFDNIDALKALGAQVHDIKYPAELNVWQAQYAK